MSTQSERRFRFPRWTGVVLALFLPALATFAIVSATTRDSGAPPAEAGTAAEPAPAELVARFDDREVNEDELDRLIRVHTERASERNESLEYQTLGSLLLERAQMNASVDDYRGATDAFGSALALAPDRNDSMLGQGQASLGVHDFATARSAAESLLTEDPNDTDAIALYSDAAFATGDYDEAEKATEQLLEADPDNPAVLVRLAQVELRRSGPDKARQVAARAIELEAGRGTPSSLSFYQSFAGHMAYSYGDYDAAAELNQAAIDNNPGDHGALGELARVRAATGRTQEAVELLERANAIVAEPDHLVLTGDLKAQLGDTDGAQADYQAAVTLSTQNADWERAWGRPHAWYLLDNGGDIERAKEVAAAELAARKDAGAWDLSAWAHYRAGELPEARQAIDAALEIGIPDAALSYHAGVISAAEGDDARAVRELTDALETNPHFDPVAADEARELLEELR